MSSSSSQPSRLIHSSPSPPPRLSPAAAATIPIRAACSPSRHRPSHFQQCLSLSSWPSSSPGPSPSPVPSLAHIADLAPPSLASAAIIQPNLQQHPPHLSTSPNTVDHSLLSSAPADSTFVAANRFLHFSIALSAFAITTPSSLTPSA